VDLLQKTHEDATAEFATQMVMVKFVHMRAMEKATTSNSALQGEFEVR